VHHSGLRCRTAKSEFIMTELLAPPTLAAAIVAAVAIASAIVVTNRAMTRATAAQRQLAALYAEIETAIGSRIDRSSGRRWRDQVSSELKRLAVASAGATGRDEAGAEWIAIAVRALGAAAALEPESEPGRIAAALGLADRLAASLEGVGAIAGMHELEDALLSGTLNDVLTTAPLVAGYFSRNASLAPVMEAYLLAAAALRLALVERGVVVEAPAVLSTISGRDARGEAMDGRELRRIPQARTLANRFADRLAPGENLVVYCSVPGWRTRNEHRPAAVVFWNSASWLV
jgi:hypothetical protein